MYFIPKYTKSDLSCTIDALLTIRTIFYKNVKNVPTMLLRRVFQV